MSPRYRLKRTHTASSTSVSSLILLCDENDSLGAPTRASERQALQLALSSDEERATRLKGELDSLKEEYDALCKSIVSRRSNLSPAHILPLEILGEVFVYSSCLEELAPLTLSRVCRLWKTTMESTPRAWCNLHVRLNRREPSALARLWLRNSKACPLQVAICDPPEVTGAVFWAGIDTIVDALRPHWVRVKVFRMYRIGGHLARRILQACRPIAVEPDFDSPSSPISDVSSSSSLISSTSQLPIVRHIALNLLPPSYNGGQPDDAADFRDLYDLFGSTPALTTFRFDRCVPSFDLPLFATSASSLKSIEIDEPFCGGYTTPLDRVFAILAACPQLHVFLLAGNQNGAPNPMEGLQALPLGKTIVLQHLRMLSLQSVDIPYFLDQIKCPSLEKLKLGNDLDAYWHGSIASSLRSLMIRSNNPPLSRLRINDISTPSPTAIDEWACFDALPNLSSFRVFASSFPDSLLTQLTLQPGDKRAICPLLNKIVFEDCSFSGEALVDFVRSRKDGNERLGVAQISDIWIGTCTRVSADHLSQLRCMVGDVFKMMSEERLTEL